MLTPQEVSSHAFTKAVMGGYNMAMVDEFLDEVTDDYTALYKENAALKAKLKVLVEKVEEYRATEDSMRATLLTAQRMADNIVQEAESKRDEMLSQAESTAREKLDTYRRDAASWEERLRRGKEELQRFIAASREICESELRFLEKLPELAVDSGAAEDAAAAEIREQVSAVVAAGEPGKAAEAVKTEEAAPEIPSSSRNQVPEAAKEKKPAEAAAAPAPVPAPAAPAPAAAAPAPAPSPSPGPAVDEEPTRRINIKELKFGRNYNGETK